MDATVTRVLAVALTCASAAQAQAPTDPTQPPAAIARPAATTEAAPAATQLQAIFRGPGEQRTAVISGQRVRVGDSITTAGGPARVAAIFDDRVLLVRGAARETLALHPAVVSRPNSSPGK